MKLWSTGMLMLLAGCAAKQATAPATEPAEPAPVDAPDDGPWPGLADADRTVLPGGWQSEARQDHPLVGVRWHVAENRPVGREELVELAARHRWVLLGEKHDNADHHRLQARLIGQLAAPEAIVAFEMLDEDDAGKLPTPFATNSIGTPGTPPTLALEPQEEADRIAKAVDWESSGWPPFDVYRPVFASTVKSGADIVAAHPARERLKAVMMEGLDSLSAADREGLRLERTYDDATLAAVEEHIQEVHCGMAPEPVVPMMVRGQHLKDAWMARALEEAAIPEIAGAPVPRPAGFLVAGGGHTRPDRGVPMFLANPEQAFVIALREVPRTGEEVAPEDLVGLADIVWFTPRVDDIDPCVKYAEELEKLGPVE